jgi:hypothetical protein
MLGFTYDLHNILKKQDKLQFVKDYKERLATYIKSLHPDLVHTIFDNLVFKTKRMVYTVNKYELTNWFFLKYNKCLAGYYCHDLYRESQP